MFELVRNVATLSPRAGAKIIFPTDNSSPSNYAAFRYQTIVGNNSRCFDVVARRFSNTLFPRDPFSKNSRIRVLHVYTITRVHVSTIVQTIARTVSYMIVACRYYAEQPYTSYCLVLLTNTPIDFHPPNFPHV